MVAIYTSERRFQFWEYNVSHGQLLLRSNPTDDANSRVELYFKDAVYVSLPRILDGVHITEPSAERLPAKVKAVFDMELAYRTFRIQSSSISHYIVAGALFLHDAELPFSEPSVMFERAGKARYFSDPRQEPEPDVRRL